MVSERKVREIAKMIAMQFESYGDYIAVDTRVPNSGPKDMIASFGKGVSIHDVVRSTLHLGDVIDN